MPDAMSQKIDVNKEILKQIRLNRWILLIAILILLGVLYATVLKSPAPIVPPIDTGPGPITSGKIKKPGSSGDDLLWYFNLKKIESHHIGETGHIPIDLMNSSIQIYDGFESTYTYNDAGQIKTNEFDITSTTIKIDNDGDGTFEPTNELELSITSVSCQTAPQEECCKGIVENTCLNWTNETSQQDFIGCHRPSTGKTPACTNRGVPPEFLGRPAANGWSVVRKDPSDPVPLDILEVDVELQY